MIYILLLICGCVSNLLIFAIANIIHNILFAVDTKSGDIMHIEYLIKEIRLRKHMSLRELNRKADVSVGHLSEIERGLKEPSFFVMVRISKALKEPLENLYKIIY